MKESQRKYTGVLQFFHNYSHDPEGRQHCTGAKSNPYIITHFDGKHIINLPYAKGHGKKCKTQWFKFTRKLHGGWDLSSGIKIDRPPVDYDCERYL